VKISTLEFLLASFFIFHPLVNHLEERPVAEENTGSFSGLKLFNPELLKNNLYNN